MTWSILARDGDGTFGVAIASRFFAVDALASADGGSDHRQFHVDRSR